MVRRDRASQGASTNPRLDRIEQNGPFIFSPEYITQLLNRIEANERRNRAREEEGKNQDQGGNNIGGEDPTSWTSLLVMAQKRQNLLRQMKQELVLNIIIFLILLVIVLFSVRINTQNCGEPLLIWLIVYIVFFLFKLTHSLANLCSIYKNSEKVHTLAAIKILLINPFQIGWLVYGNVLYFNFNSGI